MNSLNDNIYTASDVMQDKKVHTQALGRRIHSKSKLHSSSQADHNWKLINAFAMRLERQMGAAHSICTRVGPKHWSLFMGNWSVTLLNGKEQEVVWEAEQYHLDIVGVSSTKCHSSNTVELNEGWKLFYSGVDVTISAQGGVGIFVSPRLAHCATDWIPLGGRICLLKLRLQEQ